MGYIWVDDKEDDQKFKSHLEKQINEATTSLSNTNSGLLADIKKLKGQVKEKENITVDEYDSLKSENERLKNNSNENETELQKQMRVMQENLNSTIDSLKTEVKTLKDTEKNALLDGKLAKALAGINVKSTLMAAADTIIRSKASVVTNDGKKVVMVGDKTVEQYAKEWATTDEGKNFVKAPSNNGGGGGGGNPPDGGSGNEKFFDKKSKQYNITKQVMLKKSNPDEYARLVKKFS